VDDAEQLQDDDETLAKLLLERTVNQAWKKRFAEMMESLDAKDLVRAAYILFAKLENHWNI
jgi:hypothetical protein